MNTVFQQLMLIKKTDKIYITAILETKSASTCSSHLSKALTHLSKSVLALLNDFQS